ncbi:MAG: T9SS type A sorting domain-containing protein [Winogradskyella sp.]|uniref:T9SS type A sorting domain-containing protein n=1 Tax=Winogradskyella sp. TaxID=1883156 RepID=UPI003859AD12
MNDLKPMKNQNYTMKLVVFAALICVMQQFQAQENAPYRIISSNVGSSGASHSIETTKGIYNISQSIGQASVIGTHSVNGYVLRQGYQQPLTGKIDVNTFDYELKAKVYPNPFDQEIAIKFSSVLKQDIEIILYDINGKVIHKQQFLPAQHINVMLSTISGGTYFLDVVSGKKRFTTKLIKI